MSHPYAEQIGGHWKGCYEEHLGCANWRLQEARSHANYLADTLREFVNGKPNHEQAKHALTIHKEWEESQP